MKRSAFTLVELLVVIAIIGMLVALLLPAINSARESGRRAQCMNNIKHLALACINSCETTGSFPVGMSVPLTEEPSTTIRFGPNWVIQILPYLEYDSLYKDFDLTKDISSPTDAKNVAAKAQSVKTMLCPSDANYNSKPYVPGSSRSAMGTTPWARGNYAANSSIQYLDAPAGDMPDNLDPNFMQGAGAHGWQLTFQRGVMGCNVGGGQRDIGDGLSNTCLIGEIRAGVNSIDHRGTWALGECGASTLWGHGCMDGSGVNNPAPLSDDSFEGTELVGMVGEEWLALQAMGVDQAGHSWQAGVRSLHPAGANIAMCDGSVHFLSDTIACNSGRLAIGNLAGSMQVFERLMGAGDSLIIDNTTLDW
jgi:prepilin-type N-terminal cleavage/methylation domain-containing protein/prepilin-type processing-associated H-X9-DG protein